MIYVLTVRDVKKYWRKCDIKAGEATGTVVLRADSEASARAVAGALDWGCAPGAENPWLDPETTCEVLSPDGGAGVICSGC